jgi:hypothetical protein
MSGEFEDYINLNLENPDVIATTIENPDGSITTILRSSLRTVSTTKYFNKKVFNIVNLSETRSHTTYTNGTQEGYITYLNGGKTSYAIYSDGIEMDHTRYPDGIEINSQINLDRSVTTQTKYPNGVTTINTTYSDYYRP